MISIDVNEIMSLGEEFEELAGPVMDGNLKQGAHVAGAELQSEARALVPVDTGALRISIEHSASPTSTGIQVEVGPTQPYGREIEHGRPPGTYVSAAALSGWAKRKGLNPHAVSWAIMKKGSPAQPFMGPAADKKEQSVILIMAQAVANAFAQVMGKK